MIKVFAILIFLVSSVAAQDGSGIEATNPSWRFDRLITFRTAGEIAARSGVHVSNDPDSVQMGKIESFIYSARFKNVSGKEIDSFSWEHVFSSLDENRVLNKHYFIFPWRLKKGQTRKADPSLAAPPTKLIAAEQLSKNAASPYRESIRIQCVIFKDGTKWELANGNCDRLRKDIEERKAWLKKNR